MLSALVAPSFNAHLTCLAESRAPLTPLPLLIPSNTWAGREKTIRNWSGTSIQRPNWVLVPSRAAGDKRDKTQIQKGLEFRLQAGLGMSMDALGKPQLLFGTSNAIGGREEKCKSNKKLGT